MHAPAATAPAVVFCEIAASGFLVHGPERSIAITGPNFAAAQTQEATESLSVINTFSSCMSVLREVGLVCVAGTKVSLTKTPSRGKLWTCLFDR